MRSTETTSKPWCQEQPAARPGALLNLPSQMLVDIAEQVGVAGFMAI
jgi:hypothetical protein